MAEEIKITDIDDSFIGNPGIIGISKKSVKITLNSLNDLAFRKLEYNNDSSLTEVVNRELTRLRVPKNERITGMAVTYRINTT